MRSGAGETELEARIESLPPATAAGSFNAGGRTVTTTTSTVFEQQGSTRTFADLTIGLRVHVKGSASGSDLAATRVQMQSANSGPSNPNPPSPAPAPAPDANEVETTGTIGGLSGSASAFQFTLGGTLFKGDATTAITGSSRATLTFAALKNGVRVEVKGVQDTGFVKLSRVHVEDDDDDATVPPTTPTTPAWLTGTLTAKSGSVPNLTLTVAGNTVKTNDQTKFKNRGNVVPLDGLAVGQTLEIEGSKQSDGSIWRARSRSRTTRRPKRRSRGRWPPWPGPAPRSTSPSAAPRSRRRAPPSSRTSAARR